MAERCMVCNGSGKYAPMGGIQVKCIHCEGLGFVGHDKSEQNRLKMQINTDAAIKPAVCQPSVMPVNVPVTPMIAPESTPANEPLAITTNEIEAIKSRMLKDATLDPAQMDKRSRAYRAWKTSQG